MNPGLYKDRIAFVTIVENDDGMGGATVSTSELIRMWASVKPMNGVQQLKYNQMFTAQGYQIECRALKQYDITTGHGVTYDGKLLNIHSVVEEDGQRLKIIAYE